MITRIALLGRFVVDFDVLADIARN